MYVKLECIKEAQRFKSDQWDVQNNFKQCNAIYYYVFYQE